MEKQMHSLTSRVSCSHYRGQIELSKMKIILEKKNINANQKLHENELLVKSNRNLICG